jgi:hypothetical protein
MKEILRAIRNVFVGVIVLGLTFGFAMLLTAYEMREAHMIEIQDIQNQAINSRNRFRDLCAGGDLFKFEQEGTTYFCLDADALDNLDGMLEPQDAPIHKPKDGEYTL